jgi:hypothetical protein
MYIYIQCLRNMNINIDKLIDIAYRAITKHRKEYAPNVHEIQEYINKHLI